MTSDRRIDKKEIWNFREKAEKGEEQLLRERVGDFNKNKT